MLRHLNSKVPFSYFNTNHAEDAIDLHPVLFILKVDNNTFGAMCIANCFEFCPFPPSAHVFSGKHLHALDDHGQRQGGGTTKRLGRPANLRLVDKSTESRAKSPVDLATICPSMEMFSRPSFFASLMIVQGVEVSISLRTHERRGTRDEIRSSCVPLSSFRLDIGCLGNESYAKFLDPGTVCRSTYMFSRSMSFSFSMKDPRSRDISLKIQGTRF